LAIELKTLGADHPDLSTTYFELGNCFKELRFYNQAIENYIKGFEIDNKGGYPFRIAQCYEALLDFNSAFDYYVQSGDIRRNHPEVGLEHTTTQESIAAAVRIAKQIRREDELPKWMNERKRPFCGD